MIGLVIGLAIVGLLMYAAMRRHRRSPIVWPPVCPKCGTETRHYCGMVCVEICPICHGF